MQRRTALVLLNTLSASRFAFAGAFATTEEAPVRVGLVLAAGLTDVLDGWIARRKHLATRFGALMDPLADRTFVLTALALYRYENVLATWAFAVLLVRDVATTLAYLGTRLTRTFRHVEFKARASGKVVTAMQFLVLLLAPLAPGWIPAAALVAGGAGAWSVADYAVAVWNRRARGSDPGRGPTLPRERAAGRA